MTTAVQSAASRAETTSDADARARPAPYTNPYLAGIGLGLVLLSAFVIMGRGLGSSGAYKALAAFLLDRVAPAHARASEFIGSYFEGGANPLRQWLVFEVLGLGAGAYLSGLLARRVAVGIEKGELASIGLRLALAFAGGLLSAIGAGLARGCTSGQALTGGALLNLGSWIFMMSVFAGAYALAYFVRREWR